MKAILTILASVMILFSIGCKKESKIDKMKRKSKEAAEKVKDAAKDATK